MLNIFLLYSNAAIYGDLGAIRGISAQRLIGYSQPVGLNTCLLTSIDCGSVRHGVNTASGLVTHMAQPVP